jgi:hypothetical protein
VGTWDAAVTDCRLKATFAAGAREIDRSKISRHQRLRSRGAGRMRPGPRTLLNPRLGAAIPFSSVQGSVNSIVLFIDSGIAGKSGAPDAAWSPFASVRLWPDDEWWPVDMPPATGLTSRFENSVGSCFRDNPSGGGSFAVGPRWLGRHSPLRGCSGLAALAVAKISRRGTPRSFQTGS